MRKWENPGKASRLGAVPYFAATRIPAETPESQRDRPGNLRRVA